MTAHPTPPQGAKSVFERLDEINEFERQPVGPQSLQPGRYFAGSFAGEHVAATEFVIGALFVTWGASAVDLLVGLALGNLLAVLSWTLVCAPIAVKTRLTLYWYLRKIAGPPMMVVYNVLNAVMYCVLAGCMITVSASAIRIPFGIEPQVGWVATDPWFYPVVLGVGAVVVALAILGFKRLAQFSAVCSPWMFLMFLAGALVLLPKLGQIGDFREFWEAATTTVWTGPPPYESMEIQGDKAVLRFDPAEGELKSRDGAPLWGFSLSGSAQGEEKYAPAEAEIRGPTVVVSSPAIAQAGSVRYSAVDHALGASLFQAQADGSLREVPSFRTYVQRRGDVIGFWHIVAFAWVCNLAMHLGLSDMALFRYARRARYGLFSSFGMFLGHYLAWICAGIMGAAVAGAAMLDRPLTSLDSGEVAYQALGAMGALAVVLAGWTTANPTLYRAGLALQVVTPGWPRWLMTLLAGAVTTLIACSPFVFQRLLGFVAIYGILLVPVGAIVVAEHWIVPRLGWTQFWSARKGQIVNLPALAAWLAGLGFAAYSWGSKYFGGQELVHEFFLVVPVWFLTTAVYLALSALAGAQAPAPELAPEPAAEAPAAPARPGAVALTGPGRVIRRIAGIAALAAIVPWLLARAVLAPEVLPLAEETVALCRGSLPYVQWVFFIAAIVWLHLWEKSLPWRPAVSRAALVVVLASLALCLAFPAAVAAHWLPPDECRQHLPLLTLVYFLGGIIWTRQREKREKP
jgi:purine-cytosine permease-like protein